MPNPRHRLPASKKAKIIVQNPCKSEQAVLKTTHKFPKIYFGTRTHKQIAQIVHELRRTAYRPRIAILGSRNQFCVHPRVSKSSNKNDDCKVLVEQRSCSHYERAKVVKAHSSLAPHGETQLFDIEDLVTVGRKVKGCVYYASKMFALEADIIFCPYNYLIDPLLREVMDINVDGNIVLLDEAHNIEDAARSAGSLEITDIQLIALQRDVDQLSTRSQSAIETDMKFVAHVS
jgi:Fanconi anemia group J protein